MSDDCLTSVFLPLNVAEQECVIVLRSNFLVNGCHMSFMSVCLYSFCCIIIFNSLFPVYLSSSVTNKLVHYYNILLC